MIEKHIEFLDILHLRGPNMWTDYYYPVLEAWIDIGELEDYPSNKIPGFYERLSSWMPSLIEHRCSYEERGGFLRRLEEGTWPGHILEHVALELQNLAGTPDGFGRTRETSKRGVYKLVISSWHPELSKQALIYARDLVLAAMDDKPFDIPAAVEHLSELYDDLCIGPSTANIVKAADTRGIPYMRLNDGNLIQFGHGANQRRIWTAETDQTSAIAESISRDKDLTKTLLEACGIPVPEGYLVNSADDAWETAQDIGLPVVVKPRDGNHGRGVFVDLNTQKEVESAYHIALEQGSGVIVERFIRGNEHRLLVVGNNMIAAAKGESASVVGDGKSTVLELIASQLNCDPRRGHTENHPLNPVRIDSAARLELERQGLTPEGIPAAGQDVLIQRNGNVAFDVTDKVHPEVAEMVALAARVVGLDVAGIDLVAEDISRPLAEQRGAIVEVNAGPGLLMHIKPADGESRPVGKAIVDHLFPGDDAGRIPLIGITGTAGRTEATRLAAHFMQLTDKFIGVASKDGLFYNQRQILKQDATVWKQASRVVMNRAVEAAVIENDLWVMANEGLAYDRCSVGVITKIDPEFTLPENDILDREMLYKVFRTQVDVVLSTGTAILNADDEISMEMAELCNGDLMLFAQNGSNARLREHLATGKRGIYVEDGQIVLHAQETATVLLSLSALSAAAQALPQESLLSATGAAWASGLSLELLRAGLETFGTKQ